MNYKEFMVCFFGLVIIVGLLYGATKLEEPEKPVVHHMKEGFICITYRETMVCGQGTNTRPSQSESGPDEVVPVLSQITPTILYSVQF